MKRFTVLCCLALMALGLGAQEIALRKADDLALYQFMFNAADGGKIAFWSDLSSGHRDIYCQKFNSEGQVLWAEPVPVVTSPGDQRLIGVAPSSDNNFIILWEDYDIDTLNHLSVQKLSSNGLRLWGEQGIQVSDSQILYARCQIFANAIGGAFLTFQNGYSGAILGQNFDSYGNRLWPGNGLLLVADETPVHVDQAVVDGAGGFILNVRSYLSGVWQNNLYRFSASGAQVGDNPIVTDNVFPDVGFGILPPVNGEYLLYRQPQDYGFTLYLNKMDVEGNLLYPDPIVYNLSGPDFCSWQDMARTPDGGLLISWVGGSWSTSYNLYVQKFLPNLIPAWNSPVLVSSDAEDCFGSDLTPAADGKLWITWRGNWENQFSRAQVLSPDGVPFWEAGGKLLSDYSTDVLCFVGATKGVFLWKAVEEGYNRIQLQAIGVNGALSYPSPGLNLEQKLNNNTSIIGTYALGDRWLTLWSDNREKSSIYYQLLNQNLEPLLEANGRRLNNSSEAYSYINATTVTADGKLALIYTAEVFEPNPPSVSTWLQMIDSNGELYYIGAGYALPGDHDYQLSSSGDAIYLGWTKFNVGPVHQVIGQKFVNGIPMWGVEGKVLASAPLIYHISLKAIAAPYYCWNINSPDQERLFCRVLRLDGNGDPSLGWPAEGMDIIADNWYLTHELSEMATVGDDLVAFVHLYKTGSYGNRVQRINLMGERLWGSGGHAIGGSDQWMRINDVVYGEDLYLITSTQGYEDQRRISFRHINASGDEITQPAGTEIVPDYNNVYDASLVRFANGSFLCAYSDNDGAWLQNRNVFTRQLSPDGTAVGNESVLLCGERYQQDYVSMAAIGNRAFIAWADDRAGIMNSEEAWTGIWGNMVTSAFTPNDDPQHSPLAQPVIEGNYPNPFNPSTSIAFSLPDSAPVTLAIYNLKGQLVRTLLSHSDLSSGKHTVIWDGRDDNGRGVSSGVYLCRLSNGSVHVSKKMLLAK